MFSVYKGLIICRPVIFWPDVQASPDGLFIRPVQKSPIILHLLSYITAFRVSLQYEDAPSAFLFQKLPQLANWPVLNWPLNWQDQQAAISDRPQASLIGFGLWNGLQMNSPLEGDSLRLQRGRLLLFKCVIYLHHTFKIQMSFFGTGSVVQSG